MAEILIFRARPRSENEIATRYAESAKILFFTGVRYLRMDDAAASVAAAKSPRRGAKPAASRKARRKRA